MKEFEDKSIKRFWGKVEKTEKCWLWKGCIGTSGYGTIRIEGKTYTAHRFSFILANSFIPSSAMDIMHLCDNKVCVNPDHLKLGTRLENILDFISKGGVYGKSGEKNHNCKITDLQYKEIKKRLFLGEMITKLEKEFGITRQSIRERMRHEK